MCTRIGIIEQGRMMAEGSLEEIFRRLQLLRVVHVQLVDPAPGMLEAVAKLPGVAGVEIQADRVAIRLREGEVAVEDLHAAIVALGARMRMFQAEPWTWKRPSSSSPKAGPHSRPCASRCPGCRRSWPRSCIELSPLRRTYIMRVVYAAALLALLLAATPDDLLRLHAAARPTMGAGGELFGFFIRGSLAAIYLFLPLLVAPLVTDEEERGNLDVLMVSGIGPWEYIVEKLVSRLVGMGSLLVIGLPFSAFAYSLGGVDSGQLLAAAVALGAACMQVGCWSMWCSARSHTSMRAIGQAYGWGVPWLLLATPAMVGLLSIANVIILKALDIRGAVVMWGLRLLHPLRPDRSLGRDACHRLAGRHRQLPDGALGPDRAVPGRPCLPPPPHLPAAAHAGAGCASTAPA